MKKGFGPHLILDGYECNREKLSDLDFIYRFLDVLPEKIEMSKIAPPYVTRYTAGKPEDWGISGFVIIAESHISIHTFPEKLYLSVDVFSCKPFDTSIAIKLTEEWFEIGRMEYQVLDRGRDFPHDIFLSARVVNKDRQKIVKLVR
ncbi:adenosylmethionine decarboxylase [Candidatus Poribacteria bacterium]|nr:adenosylmethionine decarboxylase [Candidatus Poribacteria bacterium]